MTVEPFNRYHPANDDAADAIAAENAEALSMSLLCGVGLLCFIAGGLFSGALATIIVWLRG